MTYKYYQIQTIKNYFYEVTTLAATTTLRYLSVRHPLQEQGDWRLRITASVRRTAGKMSATERSHPSKHTSEDILMKVINSFRTIKN